MPNDNDVFWDYEKRERYLLKARDYRDKNYKNCTLCINYIKPRDRAISPILNSSNCIMKGTRLRNYTGCKHFKERLICRVM